MDIIIEFWKFLIIRKKYWLAPIVIIILILGGLIYLSQGTVVGPLIYTIF